MPFKKAAVIMRLATRIDIIVVSSMLMSKAFLLLRYGLKNRNTEKSDLKNGVVIYDDFIFF